MHGRSTESSLDKFIEKLVMNRSVIISGGWWKQNNIFNSWLITTSGSKWETDWENNDIESDIEFSAFIFSKTSSGTQIRHPNYMIPKSLAFNLHALGRLWERSPKVRNLNMINLKRLLLYTYELYILTDNFILKDISNKSKNITCVPSHFDLNGLFYLNEKDFQIKKDLNKTENKSDFNAGIHKIGLCRTFLSYDSLNDKNIGDDYGIKDLYNKIGMDYIWPYIFGCDDYSKIKSINRFIK